MFVFGLILLAVALAGLATLLLARSDEAKGFAILALPVGLLGGIICIVIASMSTVPTRNVGIVTEFSKPTGRTTGAGLKWHAPWQSIDDWDASGQTYAHLGDQCVWVTIAAQRRACVPVQIEYSSLGERAPENWAAYKEAEDMSRFEVFVSRRVNPQINAAMTSVFATFDPLKGVDSKSGDAPAPDLNATYKQPLLDALTKGLGQDIHIRSIAFEAPRYDEPTTNAINAYGQKILEARNLTIDQQNALTRKAITETNAKVNNTTRCLEIAEKLGKEPGLCMTPAAVTRPVS